MKIYDSDLKTNDFNMTLCDLNMKMKVFDMKMYDFENYFNMTMYDLI